MAPMSTSPVLMKSSEEAAAYKGEGAAEMACEQSQREREDDVLNAPRDRRRVAGEHERAPGKRKDQREPLRKPSNIALQCNSGCRQRPQTEPRAQPRNEDLRSEQRRQRRVGAPSERGQCRHTAEQDGAQGGGAQNDGDPILVNRRGRRCLSGGRRLRQRQRR